MSWSFRTLVFGVAILWALVPQIACFMPDGMTETEQECCKQMAMECGGSGMTHECCRTVVRPDVGTLAARTRSIAPNVAAIANTFEPVSISLLDRDSSLAISSNHAPPPDPGTSSVILRI